MDIVINGLNNSPAVTETKEYVDTSLLSVYLKAMQDVKQYMDDIINQDNSHGSTHATNFYNAISTLRNLAVNGFTAPGAKTIYLSPEMATNTANLLNFLTSTKMDINQPNLYVPNNTTLTSSSVGIIKTLAEQGLSLVHSNARSLQSMVEIEFIRAGNEQIAAQMKSLADALQATQNALDSLKLIQGISNQINVTTPGNFTFPPTNFGNFPSTALNAVVSIANYVNDGNPTQGQQIIDAFNTDKALFLAALNGNPPQTPEQIYPQLVSTANLVTALINSGNFSGGDRHNGIATQLYKAIASAHFTQLSPVAAPTSTASSELLAAKNQLLIQIQQFQDLNMASASTVNSLPNFMLKVAADISAAFAGNTDATAAVKQWILDNQQNKLSTTGGSTAGAIQDRITQAINAAESLNDTQKEQVRNAQYNFQQFYQSASTVLQKLTQIIEKTAQGIGR